MAEVKQVAGREGKGRVVEGGEGVGEGGEGG